MDEPKTDAQLIAEKVRITIIGAGTIGLSFAALHLFQRPNAEVTIYDTRPELEAYVYESLSGDFGSPCLYTQADRI